MAISKQDIDALSSMGEQLGLAWQANTRKTRGTDEVSDLCRQVADSLPRGNAGVWQLTGIQ